jgi:predicted nucleotidyltransferase
MYDHHHRVIERLTEKFKADSECLSLMIGGSLVRDWGRPDSDIDVLLLISEEDFQRRMETGSVLYFDAEICDYEGGYIDGKYIDVAYLQDAAERGIEPTRSAFVNTQIAFSRLPELPDLIQRVTAYPEHERDAKMKAFYSELLLLKWFAGEAEKRGDAYLMTRTVADLVLFGGRLILAYNRILYPFHKWLMRAVSEAPDKPADLMELTDNLLTAPSKANAEAYVENLTNFQDWGVSFEQAVKNFTRDRERHWRNGPPPIHDW